ncbi:mechanosensitive ion channel domain-containing protein [Halapricum desulfuricans]|uniref:Small-conductance mechanosensitive channel n=1 Tax=Halapricum desulfuricans TaxID=2841257 RepID=A0A897NCX8_9EURY|nr:Small-conductance mechanosensitive channel [Halapricum desulfuricans]
MFLILDRNFNVGDFVRWNDRGGTVIGIGLRTTRVRTPNNEIVTIPNNDLSTKRVTAVARRKPIGFTVVAESRTIAFRQ